MSSEDWLLGPHAVAGQLDADPSRILEAWLEEGTRNARVLALVERLRAAGIAVRRLPRGQIEQRTGSARHQGIAARWRVPEYLDENRLLALVARCAQPLLLVLDGVTDPHNLGACIRTAAAAGANAVVVPRDRAVGLTPVVLRTSAGTAARLPLARVTNLARTLDQLKEAGLWIAGAAAEAKQELYTSDLRGALAIVLGSEGEGMRELTRKRCDYLIRIPIATGVESLNVSVAAGVLLFEALRQRRYATPLQ